MSLEKKSVKKEVARLSNEVEQAKLQNENKSSPEIRKHRLENFKEVAKQYEIFLDTPGGSVEERYQAMRRLADLDLEMERESFLLAMEDYEKGIAEGKTVSPPMQNFKRPIELYERILRIKSNLPDKDHILYQLSFGYEQMGETSKSIATLTELSKSFPESKYLQEVYFRLGEYYFDRDDFVRAKSQYVNGLKHRSSQLYYLNTLYKLGWSFYLTSDFLLAADHFRALLDESGAKADLIQSREKFPERPQAKNFATQGYREGLTGDALQVMARCFTEMAGIETATAYFNKIGERPYRADIYWAIGNDYFKQEKINEAVAAYDVFIKHFSLHAKAIEVYQSRIALYEKIGDFPKAALARESAVKFFSPSAAWFRANQEVEREQATFLRQQSIAALATYHHHLAQKNKVKEEFESAVKWYALFIEDFPKAKESFEIEYFLAECLYALGDFESAGLHYEKVVALHPERPRQIQAVKDAFIAHEAEFLRRRKSKINESGDILKKMRGNRKVYQQLDAKGDHLVDFMLREATAYYQVKEYEACREPLEAILKNFSQTKEAFSAARLLALSYYENQQYAESFRLFTQALTFTETATDKEKKDLHELRASSLFKEAQAIENRKGGSAGAKAYLRISKEEPLSTVASHALFAAGMAYMKIQNGKQAVLVFHQLVDTFPKDDRAYAALLEAANWQKNRGLHREAARDYYRAAQLAEGLPKNANSLENRKFSLTASALEWEEAGNRVDAVRVWQVLLDRIVLGKKEKVEALFHLGEGLLLQGKDQLALKALKQSVEINGKEVGSDSSYFAGKAQILIAEHYEKAYRRVVLVPPFKRNLKEKERLLNLTLKAYARAAEYRDAEVTTKGSYHIGAVLQNFARALKNSPIPRDLSSDDRERYQVLMEEQAFPFEEKAIESFEATIRSALEVKVYNDWVKKSYEQLAVLVPAHYAKTEMLPEAILDGDFF